MYLIACYKQIVATTLKKIKSSVEGSAWMKHLYKYDVITILLKHYFHTMLAIREYVRFAHDCSLHSLRFPTGIELTRLSRIVGNFILLLQIHWDVHEKYKAIWYLMRLIYKVGLCITLINKRVILIIVASTSLKTLYNFTCYNQINISLLCPNIYL